MWTVKNALGFRHTLAVDAITPIDHSNQEPIIQLGLCFLRTSSTLASIRLMEYTE